MNRSIRRVGLRGDRAHPAARRAAHLPAGRRRQQPRQRPAATCASSSRTYNRARGEILTADGQIVAPVGAHRRRLQVPAPVPAGRAVRAHRRLPVVRQPGGHHRRRGDVRRRATGQDTSLQLERPRRPAQREVGHRTTWCCHSPRPRSRRPPTRSAAERGSVVVLDVKTVRCSRCTRTPPSTRTRSSVHDTPGRADRVQLPSTAATSLRLQRAYRERYSAGLDVQDGHDARRRIEDRHRDAERPGLPRVGRLPATRDQHDAAATSAARSAAARSTRASSMSCNTTFAAARLRARRPVRARRWTQFGVDQRASDRPRHRARSRASGRRIGAPTDARFALAGIGQGDVFTTPLQMALVAAGIANGGVIKQPHVVKEIQDSDGKVVRTIDPKTGRRACRRPPRQTLTNMMVQVVNAGHRHRGADPRRHGRGQDRHRGDRRQGETPHAWFIAFAPADAPAVRGRGARRARRQLRQRGHRWRGRGADREAGAPDIAGNHAADPNPSQ